MIGLPTLHGLIRRRLLINFRADPEVVGRILPAPFAPKMHEGWSILGICLIRLEQIRPAGLPAWCGLSSESAAHRVAVTWNDHGITREGVYIPRRDTGALLNHWTGGRVFPGEHHLSRFKIRDQGRDITVSIRSVDGTVRIEVEASAAQRLPESSVFASLQASSEFFAGGSIGYSVTGDCCRLDGIRLETASWEVKPLDVKVVESSFFRDSSLFPPGSVHFDHALIMRDIPHRWVAEPDLLIQPPDRSPATGHQRGDFPRAHR